MAPISLRMHRTTTQNDASLRFGNGAAGKFDGALCGLLVCLVAIQRQRALHKKAPVVQERIS
ncbi:hypothetical protein F441_07821, partial [Phytophthora nicotianae CJ01A1]